MVLPLKNKYMILSWYLLLLYWYENCFCVNDMVHAVLRSVYVSRLTLRHRYMVNAIHGTSLCLFCFCFVLYLRLTKSYIYAKPLLSLSSRRNALWRIFILIYYKMNDKNANKHQKLMSNNMIGSGIYLTVIHNSSAMHLMCLITSYKRQTLHLILLYLISRAIRNKICFVKMNIMFGISDEHFIQ